MTKKFNTDDIESDLKGSAFFSGNDNKESERVTERTNERSNVEVSTLEVSPSLAALLETEKRRITKRDSFEFYVDQLEELDRIDRDQREKTGRGVNKSEIVRTALDLFLGLK